MKRKSIYYNVYYNKNIRGLRMIDDRNKFKLFVSTSGVGY